LIVSRIVEPVSLLLFLINRKMKFSPEKYKIADKSGQPFIDTAELWDLLKRRAPDKEELRDILAHSLAKKRLTLQQVAALLSVTQPEFIDEIKATASELKQKVYGNRIVLFAPLYIGNKCINNCRYCGFRASNINAVRRTLTQDEIIRSVEQLEDDGHKRLILVFGEHTDYSAGFIAATVRKVYSIRKGQGEIRRVNINAAPLTVDGFKKVKEAGIGTYQIFQESYHTGAYSHYHFEGRKADFDYRLTSLDRAMEAGLDDVGIGVLFGLYDWRYEVLGLVRHTNHLEACFNVGPHTISFPRIQNAADFIADSRYKMQDDDFVRMVAILRLAVPYTGMILTAREPGYLRDEVIRYGVSQIDAGTRIEIGAYAEKPAGDQDLNREQFLINDNRSLSEIMDELISSGQIPSFCTACYRLGRTGEHFMEFSVPGFIKQFCQPNAILTLAEYLEDYASDEIKQKGYRLIDELLKNYEGSLKEKLNSRLHLVKQGVRDIYF